MKKQLIFILIASVIMAYANNLSAQGLYMKINVGYGFKMGSQSLAGFQNEKETNNSDEVTQVNVSMGKGLNFCGTLGYMFNKNLGIDMGFSYLFGMKTKSKYEYFGSYGQEELTMSFAGRMIRINPAIVVAGGFEKIDPYAKFGLIVGVGSFISEANYEYDQNEVYTKIVYNGGVSLGFNAATGVIFQLNDRISLFAEAELINMSYAPTKGKVKKATLNGMDKLSSLTTSEKEYEFVKTIDYEDNQFDSEPSKMLKQKYPFGSIGINAGLRIKLR